MRRSQAREGRTAVRVAVVGPEPAARGGVARAINALLCSPLAAEFELVPIATHRDGSRSVKVLQAARGLAQLARLSLTKDVDLVHVNSSWGGSFPRKALAVAIARAGGRAVVLQLHGSAFRDALQGGGVRGALARHAFRRVARAADAVVAATPAWAAEVAAVTRLEHIHVVPNAPDVPSPDAVPSESGSPATVLFLGRIERAKGVFDLLDAFAALRRERPQLRLVVAGRGSDEAKLRAAAAAAGVGDAVDLAGWVEGVAKQRLLARASCLVLPSYGEGLPLAVLEAMISGVPIVATRVGGVPEAVRDGREALLVEPGDVAGIAAAVGRVLDDRALATRLAVAARARGLSEFGPERVAADLGAVYAEALASATRRRPQRGPSSYI